MREVTFKRDFDFRQGATITAFKQGRVPASEEAISAARAAGALEEDDEGPADNRAPRSAGKAEKPA